MLASALALAVGCLAPAASAAVTLDSVVARMATQARLYPQEKVYLHIDHSQCARGERVNYRAYCVNAITHEPSDTSRFVYVELIDGEGKVLTRNKNVNDYGCAMGYLTLPKDAPSGICYLRAYTRRSAGDDARFASVTPIMVSARQREGVTTLAAGVASAPVIALGEQQGIALLCDDATMRVAVGEDLVGRQLSLVILNRLVPFYFKPVLPGERLDISVDQLPSGIGRMIVVNQDYDIVASAAFARLGDGSDGDNTCPVEVEINVQDYTQLIDVALPTLLADEEAQLSIGVSRMMTFDSHRDIGYDLDVVAEVPMGVGWIPPDVPERLSPLLSMNQGERYDLQRALHGDYLMPTTDVEVTTTVTGTAQTLLLHKPIKNAFISCISPTAGVYSSTVTDDKGCFILGGLDVVGDNEFVVQALNEKGSGDVFLKVSTTDFPATGHSRVEQEPFSMPDDSNSSSSQTLVEVTDEDVEPIQGEGTVVLPNLEVRGFRLGHQGGETSDFSAFSDFTFTESQIEKFSPSSIHDIVRRLPGVFYRVSKDLQPRIYIRATTTILGDTPALIVIDGMNSSMDDLNDLNVYEVERVDIFKSGSTVMWGSQGAGGVVSIRTKRGFRPTGENHQNIATVKPLGIQRPEAVKLDNNGKTLYWNPDVVLAGGPEQCPRYRLEVTLPPDGNYQLTVEGITSNGRTIHARLPISRTGR